MERCQLRFVSFVYSTLFFTSIFVERQQFQCETSKCGFVPGEMVVVRARVVNDSSKDIVKVFV